MNFAKMQGNGNDFVVLEDLEGKLVGKEEEFAKNMCNRHFGIGADGILIVRKSDIAQIQMVIINSDGSYASMCGNGIRCFAKYVWENNLVQGNNITIETGDGIKEAILTVDENKVKMITINMGKPSFSPKEIPAEVKEEIINKKIIANRKEYNITSMLMGVPHTVVLGKIDEYNIEEGKFIETHDIFPKNTNVNFCEVINKNKIQVKTWERGAGPTLACGTGSCACVVACNKLGLINSKAEVKLPGGRLIIEITEKGVLMTGPAEFSFRGEYVI